MFSQKKKNYTWIYVCGILAIVIVAVLLLIGALSAGHEDEALQTSLEKRAEAGRETETPSEKEPSSEETYNNGAPTDESGESSRENQFYQSYYLVKYDKNVIKIFFSDETGKLVQLEETAIVYETLTPQDQTRFLEGIRLSTRDELNRLMMNYES